MSHNNLPKDGGHESEGRRVQFAGFNQKDFAEYQKNGGTMSFEEWEKDGRFDPSWKAPKSETGAYIEKVIIKAVEVHAPDATSSFYHLGEYGNNPFVFGQAVLARTIQLINNDVLVVRGVADDGEEINLCFRNAKFTYLFDVIREYLQQ